MQINARDWVFEVEDPTTPDTFIEVAELESFTLNPSENEEAADTTHFGSQGMHESQAMQRGATLQLTGKRKTDGAGVTDAGQAAVDTLGNRVGEASLGGFRFRHVDDTDWTVWTAWVTPGEQGGETNAKTSWGATFHRSGPATTEAVVAA